MAVTHSTVMIVAGLVALLVSPVVIVEQFHLHYVDLYVWYTLVPKSIHVLNCFIWLKELRIPLHLPFDFCPCPVGVRPLSVTSISQRNPTASESTAGSEMQA